MNSNERSTVANVSSAQARSESERNAVPTRVNRRSKWNIQFSRWRFGFVCALLTAFAAYADEPKAAPKADDKPPSTDLLDTAARNDQLKTFMKVVAASGLEERLRGAGPFTLLVPNEEAFTRLTEQSLDELLKDKTLVRKLVNQHVLVGKLTQSDIAKQKAIQTLADNMVLVKTEPVLKIDNAGIVTADIACTNGILHVVDAVIAPR